MLIPKIKMWLETENNESVIGKGGIDLIMAIHKNGSIHKAAQKLEMSYSHASDLLNEINGILNIDILEKTRGGPGGGGTKVTPEGMKLVEAFEEINNRINAFVNEIGSIRIDN